MASSSMKSAGEAITLGKRESGDDLETNPILKKHKENFKEKETTEGCADSLQLIERRVELLETESDQANLISAKEGLDEPPNSVEQVVKMLYVGHLARQIKISDIITFFQNVGQVVRVILIAHGRGSHGSFGFVEFAFANEAKKALEKKKGEYLYDREVFLGMPKKSLYTQRTKFWMDHQAIWYQDYLRQQSLMIKQDKRAEGLDEDPNFYKIHKVEPRKKTLLVANLSPQTKISHITNLFESPGQVVSVRLIVNNEGKHVGCAFVEFAYAYQAKKALEYNGEYWHGHKIFVDMAEMPPYPLRPKHNLAERLWYEDYLQREILLRKEDERVEGIDKTPAFVEEVAVRKKTLFVANLSPQTEISHIINFFKNVGEVVHVRLIVDAEGKHVGNGFVEFASADEANKALEEKNGENLHDHEIFLDVAMGGAEYLTPKYCIDHKVWYEEYLRRESLLIEEDDLETMEGLVEGISVRKKTLFVANLSPESSFKDVKGFFKNVGRVVSVRLIVDEEAKHVGCAFAEFASADEAKEALKNNGLFKKGHEIFVDVVEIPPYPLRPKYNLAEELWKKIEEGWQESEEEEEEEDDDDWETIFVYDEEAF